MQQNFEIKVYGNKNNSECLKIIDYCDQLSSYYSAQQQLQAKQLQHQQNPLIPYIKPQYFLYDDDSDKIQEIIKNFESECVEDMEQWHNEKKKNIKNQKDYIFILVDENILISSISELQEIIEQQNLGEIYKGFQFHEQKIDQYQKKVQQINEKEKYLQEQLLYQQEIEARLSEQGDINRSQLFKNKIENQNLSLDKLIDKANYKIDKGEFEEVFELIETYIQKKIQEENNQYKKWSYELQVSYLMGKLERRQGNYQKSLEYIEYCIQEYRNQIGDGGIIIYKFQEEYLNLLIHMKKYQEGQTILDKLKLLQSGQFQKEVKLKIGLMVQQGILYDRQGNTTEAGKVFKECQDLINKNMIIEQYQIPEQYILKQ